MSRNLTPPRNPPTGASNNTRERRKVTDCVIRALWYNAGQCGITGSNVKREPPHTGFMRRICRPIGRFETPYRNNAERTILSMRLLHDGDMRLPVLRLGGLIGLMLVHISCVVVHAGEDAKADAADQATRRQFGRIVRQINSRRADNAFCAGFDAILSKQWVKALKEFQEAERLCPESVRTRRHVLKCLYELNRREDFEKEAASLARVDPKCVSPRLYRGDFYRRDGKIDKALGEYVAALEIKDPVFREDLIYSLRHAVRLYIERNDATNAIRFSQRIVEIDPTDTTLIDRLRLARLQQITGKNEDAYKNYLQLSQMDQVRATPVLLAEMLWSLTQIGRQLKRYDKANQFLVEMLNIGQIQEHKSFKDAIALAFQIGTECYERGEYAMAYELLSRAAVHEKKARLYLAKAALETGHVDEGATLINALLQEQSDEIEVLLLAIRLGFLRKDAAWTAKYRDKTITTLQAKLKDEADPLLYYFLGTLELQAQNYDAATNALKKALALNPPKKLKWRCLLSMAKADEGLGKLKEAETHLEGILAENAFPPAHYYLADLLYRRTDALQKAGDHAKQAIQADPTNSKYIMMYLDICLKRWQERKDRAELTGAMAWLSDHLTGRVSCEVYARVGDSYALTGDEAQASRFWRKALGLASEGPTRDRALIESLKKKLATPTHAGSPATRQ